MSSENKKITELTKGKEFTYSIEVTPDISLDKIEKLTVDPKFISITWHARQHHCKNLQVAPLKLAKHLRSKHKNVMMHLSCDLMKKDYLMSLLEMLQSVGVCNLLVVLGESFDPKRSEFLSTSDLVKYIKQHYGNYFCIGVAGFPEGSEKKLLHLKEKVDAGADFVITQAFFDSHLYVNFVSKCESLGIKVPIIPGVYYCETYRELANFIDTCKVKVSENVLKNVKENPEPNSCVGPLVLRMVTSIIASGVGCNHFQIFSLNKLDNVAEFVKEIN